MKINLYKVACTRLFKRFYNSDTRLKDNKVCQTCDKLYIICDKYAIKKRHFANLVQACCKLVTIIVKTT